jgi:hypothetical protein
MLDGPITLWELTIAFALVGLGIVVGTVLAARRPRTRRVLPFDPRCLR